MNVFTQLVRLEPLMKDLDLGSPDNPLDALYFGIGLGIDREFSYELPFDVVLTILAAEKIKRELELRGIDVLIADENTKMANRYSLGIDELADIRRDQILSICRNLGLENWKVYLASEIAKTPEYQEILSSLPFFRNQYLLMELADMEWFRRIKGTDIKLGWTSSATDHDERWFDSNYRRSIGTRMTFPYTEAGRTVRGNAAPPYLHLDDSRDRLLIREGEEIERKFRRMPPAVQKFYGHLTNLFASLGYPIIGDQTQEIFQNRRLIPRRLEEIYEVIS